MRQQAITVKTRQEQELIDISDPVAKAVRGLGIEAGACLLYVAHTTAGITLNETADPAVKSDILSVLQRLAPPSLEYEHLEGNAHAHIQASLLGSSVTVPVAEGRLQTGTWQGVLLGEFDGPRERTVWVQALG